METIKKHILLPTDFSENAWCAIAYALKLYAKDSCIFYLLNSVYLKASSMSDMSNKILKQTEAISKKDLQKLQERAEMSSNNPHHVFKSILTADALNVAISRAVKTYNIDLVVMGTKGASGTKEFFFGSNTVSVVKKMRLCPVLIIPEDFEFVEPKQIAFPTDFNRFYSQLELQAIIDLATLYDSKIRIVHINAETNLNDIQEYNIESLQSYLEDFEHSIHWMPKYADKVAEINDFIKELKIDMLAMVNYKHSFIENITKEPVIKKIGFQPTIPFLVAPG